MIRRMIIGTALLAALFEAQAVPHASAANKPIVFTASGWRLSLTAGNASYGQVLHGTLTHANVQYHVEGDWIPAGDAGGDLLRFYGKPFPGAKGLVSVATLYSTCNPNCAAAKTYNLKTLGQWALPGTAKQKSLRLTVQA